MDEQCGNAEEVAATDFISALLDNQLSTEIVMPSNRNLEAYSLLVAASTGTIEADFKERVLSYVENGGTLLSTGVATLETFRKELGIKEIIYCEENDE